MLSKDQMITELETNPEIRYRPVRAARNDECSSVFYDATKMKFTNIMMTRARRHIARREMHRVFRNVKHIQLEKWHKASEEDREKIECDPLKVFLKAIENCTPIMRLAPVRRGGITYKVPSPVTPEVAKWTAMKWLILAAEDHPKRQPIFFRDTLATALTEAADNEGRVVKRKQDLHRQCEANKAFAHFRWMRN